MKISETIMGRIGQGIAITHKRPLELIIIPVIILTGMLFASRELNVIANQMSDQWMSWLYMGVDIVMQILVSSVILGLSVITLREVEQGKKTSVGAILTQSIQKMPRTIAASFRVLFHIGWMFGLATLVSHFAYETALKDVEIATGPELLLALGLLVAMMLGLYFAIRRSVQILYVQFGIFLEDTKTSELIQGSASKVQGQWWWTFWQAFLPVIFMAIGILVWSWTIALVSIMMGIGDNMLWVSGAFGAYLGLMWRSYMYVMYINNHK